MKKCLCFLLLMVLAGSVAWGGQTKFDPILGKFRIDDVFGTTNSFASTNWVLSLGYVTEDVTNGLVSTNWVLSQNYATEDITNGLASTNWVNAQAFASESITNSLASTNWVLSLGYVTETVTNGLASTNWVNSQGFVTEAVTNGLAATNWVLGLNYVTQTVTNGLASTNWVLSLGYVTESVTNGLASTNWVLGLDYVTKSVTNGLASTNYVDGEIVTVSDAAKEYTDAQIQAAAPSTQYGITNMHGTIGGLSMGLALQQAPWTNSTVLGVGTTECFTVYSTNPIDTFVAQDTWGGHDPVNYSGAGNPTVTYYWELVVSDGSVTNVLATSVDVGAPSTAISHIETHAHQPTNSFYDSTWFLGRRWFGIRVGGASATINFYGGVTARNNHLSGPALQPAVEADTLASLAASDPNVGGQALTNNAPGVAPADLPTMGQMAATNAAAIKSFSKTFPEPHVYQDIQDVWPLTYFPGTTTIVRVYLSSSTNLPYSVGIERWDTRDDATPEVICTIALTGTYETNAVPGTNGLNGQYLMADLPTNAVTGDITFVVEHFP